MHRFFAPPADCQGGLIQLGEDEARHAVQVLRLKPGAEATVLDGAGSEFRGRLAIVSRREVTVEVIQRLQHPAPVARLTLFQAVPKGGTMEWIVEKATELGVSRLVPVLTARSTVRLDPREAETKQRRWERTALEAVKQCGNPWLPQLEKPIALTDAVAESTDCELNVIASLEAGALSIRERFTASCKSLGRPPVSAALWIGPEGDFTAEEYAQLAGSGALPVTLGGRVLRCETAAIAGLALLLHEWATAQNNDTQ